MDALIQSATVIVVLTLVGRLLGFLRTLFLSHLYGTGMEADAFFTALTVPTVLFTVLPGAIAAVAVPTLRGLIEQRQHGRAVDVYQKLLTVTALLFAAVTLVGMWLSPEIVALFGLAGAKAAMATSLLRWMWPSVFFIGLIGLWTSVVNVHERFFTPNLGAVANGAVVLLSFYLLVPLIGVDGLAIGTTLGFAAAAVTMLPTLRRLGYRHRFPLPDRSDEALRSMGERVVPILIGSVISQATFFFERGLTAGLGDGKIAALSYANQLFQLPIAVFGGALLMPLFPVLSGYAKRGDMQAMKGTLEQGASLLLLMFLPVTVGLVLCGEPLVALIFMRSGGAFGQEAVSLTAWGLAFYSLGLVPFALRDLWTRAFYALEDTRTPVVIGAVGIGVYLATAWLAMPWLSHGGVALSYAVSLTVQFLLLHVSLYKKIGPPVGRGFWLTAAKTALACTLMGGVLLAVTKWLATAPVWAQLGADTAAGGAVYVLTLLLVNEPLVRVLIRRLFRRNAG